ncbi:MAG: hypothetical protein ABI537_05950 [Casimicrobiaceae bacterium]
MAAPVGRGDALLRALVALAPFVACAWLYGPTLAGGLLSDDYSVLGALQTWRDEGRLVSALLAKFHSGLDVPSFYYRPLPMATYGANFAFAGADPLAWRLTNLALHLVSGGLVFAIARGLGDADDTRAFGGAALAAAIFLCFPTNVEAVAWVSGRYDLLATLFMLASVVCFQRARHWNDRWGTPSLVAALCAFASKESAALLPVFVLAIAVARALRTDVRAALSQGARDALPWILVAVAYFALRTVIFGTPLRVYPDTAPLAALLHGDWLQTLVSGGAWLNVVLPVQWARVAFLAGMGMLLAVAAATCLADARARGVWLAIAVTALASVGMVLPHLATLAANGEEGRLFYSTSALIGLLLALTWIGPRRAGRGSALRAIGGGLVVLTLVAQATLLRAAVAPWTDAGEQAIALARALPALARTIREDGYGLVLVADHLGAVPFGRNAQGGLISPPTQAAPLSTRLVVQTPDELAGWPSHIGRGLVDALRRYPLAQAWPAVESGRASAPLAPSDYFCWDGSQRVLVPVRLPTDSATGDWIGAWRAALKAGPCSDLARDL